MTGIYDLSTEQSRAKILKNKKYKGIYTRGAYRIDALFEYLTYISSAISYDMLYVRERYSKKTAYGVIDNKLRIVFQKQNQYMKYYISGVAMTKTSLRYGDKPWQ